MSDEKIVTHADLGDLCLARTALRRYGFGEDSAPVRTQDRLIAVAEADAPPLPEGWVLLTTPADSKAVFWHRDGALYRWDDDLGPWGYVADRRDRLTPLRPTVGAADVERAVREVGGAPGRTVERILRAAFEAAGIEVSDQ